LGAEIHYRGTDHNGPEALCLKWSSDPKPGKRGCVCGACYVFRREWYYSTGQCLSALPAWGCDEEALSICAWLSGQWPKVVAGRVAHRYRAKAPWATAARPIGQSRAALVCAVVADIEERNALLRYQNARPVESAEVRRWRDALARQPRTWAQWRAEVPIMPTPAAQVDAGACQSTPHRLEAVSRAAPASRANYGSDETNRRCAHCGSDRSTVARTVQCGRLVIRYRTCECGRKRTTRQILSTT
jgi:hypothetical protein